MGDLAATLRALSLNSGGGSHPGMAHVQPAAMMTASAAAHAAGTSFCLAQTGAAARGGPSGWGGGAAGCRAPLRASRRRLLGRGQRDAPRAEVQPQPRERMHVVDHGRPPPAP